MIVLGLKKMSIKYDPLLHIVRGPGATFGKFFDFKIRMHHAKKNPIGAASMNR